MSQDRSAAVLARIDHERAWWEGFLRDVGEDRMDLPGIIGEGTPKDLVSHLSGWQRRTLNNILAAAQGVPIPPTPWPAEFNTPENDQHERDVDPVNAWFLEQNRSRSAADVLAQSRAQWDELRALVASMTWEQLTTPNLVPLYGGPSLADLIESGRLFHHFHHEHEPDIVRWLKIHPR